MDEAAFTELVTHCQPQLYRIALSYVRNREDALDVVSESVYRAFVNLRSLKEPAYFNTWIIRITINQAINFSRQKKRSAHPADLAAEALAGHTLNKDDLLLLYSAIERLPENERAVVVLKYLEDLTLAQVAEILGRPLGTVKTHLHSALKALRLELKEEF